MLAAACALLAPAIDRRPPSGRYGIAIVGYLSLTSGLGEGARLILRALKQMRVATWTIDIARLSPGHAAYAAGMSEDWPPPEAPLLLHVNAPSLPMVLLRLPRRIVRGRKVIGYWAWELPVVPPDWRVGARFVHEVWVPSHFTAAAVEPLLPGRVRVVPFPLALVPPTPAALDRAAFDLPADAVVVLVNFNLASSFERKNPLAAVAAFRAAFGDRKDRVLVLKIGHPDHYPDDLARLVAAVGHAPNIRVETRMFPAADSHALTLIADIVLSLHRSEGFGLVLAEAMLLGKPAIATGWSGNLEFMNDENASLVKYRLVPTKDARETYYGSVWADPDITDAVERLRHLADSASARKALGTRARETTLVRLGEAALESAVRDLGLGIAGTQRMPNAGSAASQQ
jgi:glycosyltransferase involved in cell wall biosynthesis